MKLVSLGMRYLQIIVLSCLLSLYLNGQQECWVIFKYKGKPAGNVQVRSADSSDLPPNPAFIHALEKSNLLIQHQSRWLNAVYVSGKKSEIKKITSLPFVDHIVYPDAAQVKTCDLANNLPDSETDTILKRQIALMQGEKFTQAGLTGKGVKIGVLDVGFAGYKKTKELRHLLEKGLIKETRNFSSVSLELNLQRDHGTHVLSCLAGKTDSVNIGLATEAEYYLATYNKVAQLIEALEWFESKGIQILNNSTKLDFGYYEKENLDGESLLASKAFGRLAKAGVLVFCAMGNEGDTYWRSLISPSDAKGIISVGSVSPSTGLASSFSSLGPSFDKRLKPELVAVGECITANQYRVDQNNGTSFATPLVAGLAACAWQQHPSLKKDSLYEHLLKSGSLFPYFDYSHGYGLPQAAYFFRLALPQDSIKKTASIVQCEMRNDSAFYFVKSQKRTSKKTEELTEVNGTKVLFNNELICREGKFEGEASAKDLNRKRYCYYHIADENGFLKKYAVIKLEGHNIFYLPPKAIAAGYTLRIYYEGSCFEQKF